MNVEEEEDLDLDLKFVENAEDHEDNEDNDVKEEKKKKGARKSLLYPRGRKGRAAGKLTKGGKQRKPTKFKPGTVALREIRFYQGTTDLLLRKLPFQRLVREIAGKESDESLRFTKDALQVLQIATESAVVDFFNLAVKSQINDGRQTLMPKDTLTVAQTQAGNTGWPQIIREAYRVQN